MICDADGGGPIDLAETHQLSPQPDARAFDELELEPDLVGDLPLGVARALAR